MFIIIIIFVHGISRWGVTYESPSSLKRYNVQKYDLQNLAVVSTFKPSATNRFHHDRLSGRIWTGILMASLNTHCVVHAFMSFRSSSKIFEIQIEHNTRLCCWFFTHHADDYSFVATDTLLS